MYVLIIWGIVLASTFALDSGINVDFSFGFPFYIFNFMYFYRMNLNIHQNGCRLFTKMDFVFIVIL